MLFRTSMATLLCSCALLLGQTPTLLHPRQAATTGNTNNAYPFAIRGMRYQQILDAKAFSSNRPVRMNRIRFRMGNGFRNGREGGQTVHVGVRLALTPRSISAANASSVFAANIDSTTVVEVVRPRDVVLPKIKGDAFDFAIPFDSGKTFAYAASSGRNLCVEIRVYRNSANGSFRYPVDAYNGASSGSVAQNGSYAGCRNAITGKISTLVGNTSTLKIGRTYRTYGMCHAANLPAVLVFGATRLDAVMPGGCRLVNDALVLGAGRSQDASGYTPFALPIPGDTSMRGVSFLTQMIWFQSGATSSGLFSSNGLRNRVADKGDDTVATRVFAGGDPDTVTSGGAGRAFGLVIGFDG